MTDPFSIFIIILIAILVYIAYTKTKRKTNIQIYDDPMLTRIYNDLKQIVPDIDKLDIKLYGANDTLTENKKIYIYV